MPTVLYCTLYIKGALLREKKNMAKIKWGKDSDSQLVRVSTSLLNLSTVYELIETKIYFRFRENCFTKIDEKSEIFAKIQNLFFHHIFYFSDHILCKTFIK
jgi:hypothetical protein